MFSVVFPGQGSQKLGMAKEFFEKFELVKKLFHEWWNIKFTNFKNYFWRTREWIKSYWKYSACYFLTSYSIFKVIHKEFGLNLKKAKFIAGHFRWIFCSMLLWCFKFWGNFKILKKEVSPCKMQYP